MFSLDVRPTKDHHCVPESSSSIKCSNPIYHKQYASKYINGKDMSEILPKHALCARELKQDGMHCITDLETFANVKLDKQYDTRVNTNMSTQVQARNAISNPEVNTRVNTNMSTQVQARSSTLNYPEVNKSIDRVRDTTDEIIDTCDFDTNFVIRGPTDNVGNTCTKKSGEKGILHGSAPNEICVAEEQKKSFLCAQSCRYDKEIQNRTEKYCKSWKKVGVREYENANNHTIDSQSRDVSVPISVLNVLESSGNSHINIMESDCINGICHIDECQIPKDKTTILKTSQNGMDTYWSHTPFDKNSSNTLDVITDYCNPTNSNSKRSCKDRCMNP